MKALVAEVNDSDAERMFNQEHQLSIKAIAKRVVQKHIVPDMVEHLRHNRASMLQIYKYELDIRSAQKVIKQAEHEQGQLARGLLK